MEFPKLILSIGCFTLQRMRTGERWTVYLPWDMGYGTSDRDGMPGYSVLVFDIKLESVVSDY